MIDEDIVCFVKYYSSNNRHTVRNTNIGSLILSPERISQESINCVYEKLKEIATPVYNDKVRDNTKMQVYLLKEQDKFRDVSVTVEFRKETPTMIQIGSIDAVVLGKIASLLGL